MNNVSHQDSLRAIDVWTNYLSKDDDLSKAFKPTRQNILELKLPKFLIIDDSIDQKRNMLFNKSVLELCTLLMDVYQLDVGVFGAEDP